MSLLRECEGDGNAGAGHEWGVGIWMIHVVQVFCLPKNGKSIPHCWWEVSTQFA